MDGRCEGNQKSQSRALYGTLEIKLSLHVNVPPGLTRSGGTELPVSRKVTRNAALAAPLRAASRSKGKSRGGIVCSTFFANVGAGAAQRYTSDAGGRLERTDCEAVSVRPKPPCRDARACVHPRTCEFLYRNSRDGESPGLHFSSALCTAYTFLYISRSLSRSGIALAGTNRPQRSPKVSGSKALLIYCRASRVGCIVL